MLKNKYTYTLLLLAISIIKTVAQESLSLNDAIDIALKNNYAIRIERTQAGITKNNNNIGNAGFLPAVNLNASANRSSNNTQQEFSTGTSVSRNGALSSFVNSGVALNWTIFDGLKMFATKEKLEELQTQGDYNLKIAIENTIVQIITAYYDVVRQQQLIKATNEAIKIYDERIKIAQLKYNIGSASKVDLLQAKVDLNSQKSVLLKQNTALDNAKATLNQLLSKNVTENFTAVDSIKVDYKPVYSELQKTLTTNNNQLLSAQKNIVIANSTLKELNSLRLPQIGISAAYSFSQNKNQVGLIWLNQNLGLNTGVTATWTIFNGLKNNTQIKTAQLTLEQTKLQYQQINSLQETALAKTFKHYLNALDALKLEQENISIAEENVKIALERFRIGNSTTVELITAQKSYEDAWSRFITTAYEAKLSETELMRLEGSLIK